LEDFAFSNKNATFLKGRNKKQSKKKQKKEKKEQSKFFPLSFKKW
jgi:hypothetical protein